MKSARALVLDSLLKLEKDDGYSNLILNSAIIKNKLDKSDISFFSALFYGVIEKKITLDYIISLNIKNSINKLSPHVLNILRLSVYQLYFMDKIPDSAIVNEAVKLTKQYKQSYSSGFVNAVLRKLCKASFDDFIPDKKDFNKYLMIKYSFSSELTEFFIKNYCDDAEKLLSGFSDNKKIYLKVNTLKTTDEDLISKLQKDNIICEKHHSVKNVLITEKASNFSNTDSFKSGLFHIQDLSSQICCYALNPLPGEIIADVCAAPGGKSFTIAQLMNNNGRVDSFDLYENKINIINENKARLGINIINSGVRDAGKEKASTFYDAVLCDVPCSGLGVIGKKPEIKYKSLDMLESLPELQYKILTNSSKLLNPEGRIIYSTCTLNPDENENIINKFLSEHNDFIPYSLSLPFDLKLNQSEQKHMITFLPYLNDSDGFFISGIKKLR